MKSTHLIIGLILFFAGSLFSQPPPPAMFSCTEHAFTFYPDSITFSEAIFSSLGDSVLAIPIKNTTDSNYAYPQAKIVPVNNFPSGLSLNVSGGNPWNVFASSWNIGDIYLANFYFDVTAPIPPNTIIEFELWLKNLAPLEFDSCRFDSTFKFNFYANQNVNSVSAVKKDTSFNVVKIGHNQFQILRNMPFKPEDRISVSDFAGRKLFSSSAINAEFTLNEFCAGVYLFQISSQNEILFSKRIFVEE